jgi:hypothetical protein
MSILQKTLFLMLITSMVIAISSCSTSRLGGNPDYAATFQSYPNGVADIRLELNSNMRFDYQMKILPEPGSADTIPEVFSFKGRWGNTDSHYLIRFRRKNKPDLPALINPGYEPGTNVRIVD